MNEFDFSNIVSMSSNQGCINLGFNTLMSDIEWIDLQYDSFSRGDDLLALNQAAVNSPDFQFALHPTFDQDSISGGVIVTDIFGTQHIYSSMDEACLVLK